MRGDGASAAGEALLRRLQRLVARAASVRETDHKQLLALLDDLETTRRGLVQECAEVERQMRQATVRTTAIGAYLRTSQVQRGKRHN